VDRGTEPGGWIAACAAMTEAGNDGGTFPVVPDLVRDLAERGKLPASRG